MDELSQGFANLNIDAVLRWPSPKSKLWTLRFLQFAETDENILAVIAVGSAVRRGVASADLDLVVICRRSGKMKDRAPIEVDLRTYEADELDALIGKGNDLLGWAINYGKVLFQRGSFWDHLVRSWRDRLPLPPSSIAAQRADEAYRRFILMIDSGDYDAAHEQAVSYVTHLARARLLAKGVHPASRPELPKELRAIGDTFLSNCLERVISGKIAAPDELAKLLDSLRSNRKQRLTPTIKPDSVPIERRAASRKR